MNAADLAAMMHEPLNPDLAPYVKDDVLRHPLVVLGYTIPGLANRLYADKCKQLAQTTDPMERLWLYERPFRLEKVMEWAGSGTLWGEDLQRVLAAAWVDMEGDDTPDEPLIAQVLVTFKRLGYTTDSGRPQPDKALTIYRGGPPHRLAWSRDLETARWFARRWVKFGANKETVYRAVAPPRAVLAQFDGRGEEEVVVEPAELVDVTNIE